MFLGTREVMGRISDMVLMLLILIMAVGGDRSLKEWETVNQINLYDCERRQVIS